MGDSGRGGVDSPPDSIVVLANTLGTVKAMVLGPLKSMDSDGHRI